DLRRAAFVAFAEQADAAAGKWHGGGEKERASEGDLFGLLGVRREVFRRLLGAGRQPRQRQRRAHQPHEAPAAYGVVPLRSVFGELAVQRLIELLGFGKLFEAAPVRLAALATEPRAQRRQPRRLVL